MKSEIRLGGTLVIATLAGLTASTSKAWDQDEECTSAPGTDEYTSSTYTFNISTNDFSGVGTAYTTIHQAGDLWDGAASPVPGTDLEVAKSSDCALESFAWNDGWESITAEDLSGVPAIAQVKDRCSGGVIVECDIRFDNGSTWHANPPSYGESGRSRRAVMVHETGHCLGFNHDDSREGNLNSIYPSAGNIGGFVSLTESDRSGARNVYPDASTGTDVGVSGMRLGDTTGKTEWIPYWSTGGGTQEATAAWPNQSINRAYCLHNLGTTTQTSISFKIYLSTDDAVIETTDTVLGSYTPTLVPNDDPYCPVRSVTIPGGTSPGTYWIGAIVDPSGAVSESREDNNSVKDAQSFTVY